MDREYTISDYFDSASGAYAAVTFFSAGGHKTHRQRQGGMHVGKKRTEVAEQLREFRRAVRQWRLRDALLPLAWAARRRHAAASSFGIFIIPQDWVSKKHRCWPIDRHTRRMPFRSSKCPCEHAQSRQIRSSIQLGNHASP
jgi:hypothetical protein